MYAKIFAQIFDSSIAENYEVRHIFQDLLILADKTGCVDMTSEAIARRINVPHKKVAHAIKVLCEPEDASRSKAEDGRRLIPIDSRRNWGWIIVNYEHYRAIQDEEARRATWRDAKARQRASAAEPKKYRPKTTKTLGEMLEENKSYPPKRKRPSDIGEAGLI